MKSIAKILWFSFLMYFILPVFAKALWLVYPYPENACLSEIQDIWNDHILLEMMFSYLLTIVISIYAIYKFKFNLGVKSIALSVLGAINYHFVGGIIWIIQFGFEPYLKHSKPLELFGVVIILSLLSSVLSYKLLPNKSN